MVVPRPQPQSQPPLVRHERLRKPGKGASPLPARAAVEEIRFRHQIRQLRPTLAHPKTYETKTRSSKGRTCRCDPGVLGSGKVRQTERPRTFSAGIGKNSNLTNQRVRILH